MAAIKLSAWAN